MAKVRKTLRLSERVIEIIENRDKNKYPSETEFIEQLILDSESRKQVECVEEKMQVIYEKIQRLLDWTKDYSLPNL